MRLGSAAQRVHQEQQFHQVVIGRSANGLHHKAVAAAYVLANLHQHLAVREAPDLGRAQSHSQDLADVAGQAHVGVASEYLQFVFCPIRHRLSRPLARFPGRHHCATAFANCSLAGREGFEPSNARSKAWCLTSLATAQREHFLMLILYYAAPAGYTPPRHYS